jgi:hypothetical protein
VAVSFSSGRGLACPGGQDRRLPGDDERQPIMNALFRGPVILSLGALGGGSGTVTSSPLGINCTTEGPQTTGTCLAMFGRGEVITLTATLAMGSIFQRWLGLPCNGSSDRVCNVTMNDNQSMSGLFTPAFLPASLDQDGTDKRPYAGS